MSQKKLAQATKMAQLLLKSQAEMILMMNTPTASNNEFSEIEQMTVYPNPFGERTTIEFHLSESSRVWLSVYSIEGRKVAEILQGKMIEGNALQRWSFEADELQAGLYILELQTESGLRQHQQLVVVK